MTSLAIILGVGLLAWGVCMALRGSLLAGCVTVLALGCGFNYHLVSFEVGPITMTLDRLALIGLVAAYGLQRLLGRGEARPLGVLDFGLLALAAWLVASMLSADWRGSPDYPPPHWRLVAGYGVPAVLYWVARDARLGERAWDRLLATAVGFAFYLALSGILEVHQLWAFVFPPHIAAADLGNHFGRARGPMLQSLSFGLYLGVGLLAAMLWLPRRGALGRAALAVTVPLFATALVFTYTRTVYIAVAAGASLVATLVLARPWQKLAANALIVALLALVFGYYGVLSFQRGHREEPATLAAAAESTAASQAASSGASDRVAASQAASSGASDRAGAAPRRRPETAADTRVSAFMRLSFGYVSWKMFLDRPWLGVGFGQFPDAKLPYLDDPSTSLDLRAIAKLSHHNQFLSLLTETGIVGLALFAFLLGGWAWIAWGLWRAADAPLWVRHHGLLLLGTFAIFGCSWMFWELSFAPIDHGLLFLLAGIATGLQRQREAAAFAPARAFAEAGAGPGLQSSWGESGTLAQGVTTRSPSRSTESSGAASDRAADPATTT